MNTLRPIQTFCIDMTVINTLAGQPPNQAALHEKCSVFGHRMAVFPFWCQGSRSTRWYSQAQTALQWWSPFCSPVMVFYEYGPCISALMSMWCIMKVWDIKQHRESEVVSSSMEAHVAVSPPFPLFIRRQLNLLLLFSPNVCFAQQLVILTMSALFHNWLSYIARLSHLLSSWGWCFSGFS